MLFKYSFCNACYLCGYVHHTFYDQTKLHAKQPNHLYILEFSVSGFPVDTLCGFL